MNYYRSFKRILFKPVEFILVLFITLFVSPLLLLIGVLDIAEKLKRQSRGKQWLQKVRKSYHRNRNNPVTWG
jgi:hypothetical protein